MPKRTSSYHTSLIEDLKDPAEAANYLNAALSDSEEMFLLALRDVAESRQMARVAADVGVSRESLYHMLTVSGNPTYKTFCGILIKSPWSRVCEFASEFRETAEQGHIHQLQK